MAASNKLRVAVLISGNGSNLQAIIDDMAVQQRAYEIVAVISNNPEAYGLQRAVQAGIKTFVINNNEFVDRAQYDSALQQCLDENQVGLVVLAGFMRILTDKFVNHNLGKLINIHPSLLPNYKGLNTHQRVLDAKDQEHGASVHFVTPKLDDGPVILQAKVPVLETDDAASLAQRVHSVEHIIYPHVINWIAEGRLEMNNGQSWLDGQPISTEQQVMQLV